jgi:ubiquinone/menaquinone biosynthesis C-methylase UbiE
MADTDTNSDTQRHAWQSAERAATHHRMSQQRAQSHGLATELMLDLANLQPGNRVLDVAAGTGDQTILAAQRVGPTGYVLATDIAASMLAITAQAARDAGLRNVETRVIDAQQLDLPPGSFDAAISRNGLMFIPDLQAALTGIKRTLKPGGRFAAVVYSSVDRNPYHGLPLAIGERYLGAKDKPERRLMFALSDPAALERAFTAADFDAVAVRAAASAWEFPSMAELTQTQHDACPSLTQLLASLNDDGRAAAWAEIEDAMRQFDTGHGVRIPSEFLVVVGSS